MVIQSQSEGVSMIIANFAHQYHRELFAFPAEVGNSLHEGCHDLIRTQKAQLITSAEELIKGMGWQRNPEKKGIQKKLFIELDGEEKAIFEYLKDVARESLDNIALQNQISAGKTTTLLLKLEMKGCVNPLPGKFFELV